MSKIERTWHPYGHDCQQCKGPNDPYMLTFPLWQELTTREERRGFLCLDCVEIRLGRQLKLEDFLDAPINFGVFGFDCRTFVKNRRVA
jgi:hypothetical protein